MLTYAISAVEGGINGNMQQHVPHRRNCYELFGFDVMLDAHLHPWLIEVFHQSYVLTHTHTRHLY